MICGGTGNDRYSVDNSRDVVREGINQGTDLVLSSASYTIKNRNIENLTLPIWRYQWQW